MKIALVTPSAPSNEGVGGVVTPLAEALSARHDVTIISATPRKVAGATLGHRKVWTVGNSGLLFDLSFFLSSTLTLWWSCRNGKREFDIVHYHHHGYALGADVTTSHCCEQESVDQTMRGVTTNRPGYSLLSWLKYRHLWPSLETLVSGARRSKPIIVLSERMKREYIRRFGTPAEKIFVIPNGVDSAKYNRDNVGLYREEIRRRHSLAEHDLVVLLVGIDWVRKGVAQVIEALPLLDAFPAKLLIVGPDDPTPYRELARRCGVAEKVMFAGPTREPCKYYAASDIFLLPSLYEPFGLATLEAMATSLPVVVSREAGAAELIRDGIDGLLLEDPLDVAEIAAKLELLLADAGLRKRLGDEALRTVLKHSWSQVAERTVDVYQHVLGEPTGLPAAGSVA